MSSLPDPSALEKKIRFDLQDRGIAIALYIDLYDEAQYGADQLAWRGRFNDIGELKSALDEVITIGGDPVAQDNSTPLSLNRFNSPFARYWMPPDSSNPYPHLAQYAVHYRLRIKFNNDVALIDFGKNWPAYHPIEGERSEDWPLVDECLDSIVGSLTAPVESNSNFEILHTCGISYTDATMVLEAIGFKDILNGNNGQNNLTPEAIKTSVKDGEISDKQLAIIEKSLKENEALTKVNDDYLHTDGLLITVTE